MVRRATLARMDTDLQPLFNIGDALREIADRLALSSLTRDAGDQLAMDASEVRAASRALLVWTDRQAYTRGCFHPPGGRQQRVVDGQMVLVCRGCQARLCAACGQAFATSAPAAR